MHISCKKIKLEKFTFWLILFLAISTILLFFTINEYKFPIPWDDEASFGLQAIAWSESNSLFTSALNNERIIMWMNPAYMILTGSIYKIFGYSFALSREISWVFYIASFLVFAITLRPHVSWPSILILAAVFLIPSSLASGNLARMESVEIFLSALILYCLFRKRFILAFAILLFSGLFHFNALYLSIPILFTFLIKYRNTRSFKVLMTNWWELLALGISVIFVLIYFYFVFHNLDAFRDDMAYQFSRKFGRIPFYESKKSLVIIIAICAMIILSFLKNNFFLTVLSLFSLSFFMTYAIGQEMWYSIFCNLSFGLIGIVILNLLPTKKFLILFSSFSIIFLNFLHAGYSFAGMKPAPSIDSYIDSETAEIIEKQILLLAKADTEKKVTVSFMSRGVGMMFYPFLKMNNLQLRHKLPDQITPDFSSDICVYITRPYDPSWLEAALEGPPTNNVCKVGWIVSNTNGDVRVYRSN